MEQYLEECAAQNFKLRYVVETHLHADFVSGHCELAARTGAEIVFGRRAGVEFPHRAVREGDELRLGRVVLRFLETPGHTPESVSILVIDTEVSDRPQKVLTGDTLFIGDVGRPDLAGARGYTPEMMASMLYDSLHGKLLKLPDEVEVYPAHGAGSMCGRNISKETVSTVGRQRRFNYALAPMPKDDFVRIMTSDLPPAPAYFARDAHINRTGAPALDVLPRAEPLAAEEVRRRQGGGHVVLDVRAAAEFGTGHVPGSLNIGLGGQFATWAGSLVAPDTPLIIVAEDERRVDEAVMRLARVGLEGVSGYLAGGVAAWRAAGLGIATVTQISVDDLRRWRDEKPELQLLDVRRSGEYRSGHVPGAISAPLAQLSDNPLSTLDPQRPLAVICAGGYRSSAATSLLASRGFKQLYNVAGGTSAYVGAGYPVETEN